MKTLENIKKICNDFENKRYDLVELQSRLKTLSVADELKAPLEKFLSEVDNKLEDIRFCSLESNYYEYGLEVLGLLREKVKELEIL